jgi:hypothetical protein
LLIHNGFDLNVSDKYRRNLIHYICINGSPDMIQTVSEYLKYCISLQDSLKGSSKKKERPSQTMIKISDYFNKEVGTRMLVKIEQEILPRQLTLDNVNFQRNLSL